MIDTPRLTAKHGVGERVALADRDRGQLDAVGHVAHGIDAVAGSLAEFVDLDLSAIAEFDPSWVAAGNIVTVRVPKDDMKVELNALMGAMIFQNNAWPDINHPQFISNIDAYLAKQ